MDTSTIIAQFAALAVLIRMAACANRITSRCVPCIVRAACTALAVGALALLLSPWANHPINWPQAVFAVCVALYIWIDRRRPQKINHDHAG